MVPALVAGAALVSGLSGYFSGKQAERNARAMRRAGSYAAGLYSPSSIVSAAKGFAPFFNPMLSAASAEVNISSQAAADSIEGDLAVSGMGGSGLGTALSAGVRAGNMYRFGQTRANILANQLQMGFMSRQGQASSVLAGAGAASTMPSPGGWATAFASAVNSLGSSMASYDLSRYGQGPRPRE